MIFVVLLVIISFALVYAMFRISMKQRAREAKEMEKYFHPK